MKLSPPGDPVNKAVVEKTCCLHGHHRGQKKSSGTSTTASQDETAGYTVMGVIVLADEDDRAAVLP